MPSNSNIVCTTCRQGRSGYSFYRQEPPLCPRCGTPEVDLGPRITVPKKNNLRAWAQIRAGNHYWDQKKVDKSRPRPLGLGWSLGRWHDYRARKLLERWSRK